MQVLHNNIAVSVLGELSPGGTLMQGYTQQQLHREYHQLTISAQKHKYVRLQTYFQYSEQLSYIFYSV